MRALRSQFFLTYVLLSCVGVYIPVLLREKLDGRDDIKGNILSIGGLTIMFVPVLTAWIADAKVGARMLLAISFSLCALGSAALGLLSHSGVHGSSWILVAALAAAYGLWSFAVRPQGSLQDGLYFIQSHEMQDAGRKPPPYALVRIFGSLGYLFPLLALGAFATWSQSRGQTMAMWIPMAVATAFAAIGVLNAWTLPATAIPAREGKSLPTLEATRQLTRFRAWPMVLGMFLAQGGTAPYFGFQPDLLTDHYGLPKSWISWVPALDVVLELGPMFMAPWMIERFGARRVLLWAVFLQAARYWLFACGPMFVLPWSHATGADPHSLTGQAPMWAAIATKGLLHGPIIVGIYVVPPILLNRMATPGCRNSVQALYTMLAVGGGSFLSNLLFGNIAKALGHPAVFLLAAVLLLAGFAILMFGSWGHESPIAPAEEEENLAPPSGSSAGLDD